MATSSSAATPVAPRMSSAARIAGVFVSPVRTFTELARDPHFILAWCVQVVVSLGLDIVMVNKVGIFAMARQAMAQNSRLQSLSPAIQAQALSRTAAIMRVTFYVQPLGVIVVLLLLGWIFQGVANFLLGQESRYKQTLAMVSHAYLAQTLYGLLLLIPLLTNPGNFVLTNPLGTNPAFYLDKATTPAFLYALCTHLDIFSIWVVVLLAVGLAQLSGRKGKFGSALGAVGGLWLLYILVTSGISAAFA